MLSIKTKKEPDREIDEKRIRRMEFDIPLALQEKKQAYQITMDYDGSLGDDDY